MNHSTTAAATVTDPICGMTIDPATVVGSSTYDGRTYHFCSRGCKTKFDVAPEEYVGAAASCCSSKMPAQRGGQSCC